MTLAVGSELSKLITKHQKLTGDVSNLHLRAKDGRLTISSGNKTGVAVRTSMATECADFRAVVDGATLVGLLRGAKNVNFSVKDARLLIRDKGLRADIPVTDNSEPITFPKPDKTRSIRAKDVEQLVTNLSLTSIKEGGPDAQIVLQCDGQEMLLFNFDTYYGAFTSFPGSIKLKIAFYPQDIQILEGALSSKEDVQIAVVGAALLVTSASDSYLVPSTAVHDHTPDSLSKINDGKTFAASFPAKHLKLAIDSMSALVRDKDGVPGVNFTIGDNIAVEMVSSIGSMKKSFAATKIKKKVQFTLNYKFIRDVISLCSSDDIALSVFYSDDNAITRVQIKSNGVYFIITTTG